MYCYIAGYGRSGSTLLDMLLGTHEAVFGAGELAWLYRHTVEGVRCSCGVPLRECSFWVSVLERTFRACRSMDLEKAAALTIRTESLGGSRSSVREYVELWRATIGAILDLSGKRSVIDSSKSSRLVHSRLALLGRFLDLPVRGIHLVRDPRAVMWSVLRGSNRRLEEGREPRILGGAFRGLLGWSAANLSVERYRRQDSSIPILTLRYEDLLSDPCGSLQLVGDFLGLGLQEVLRRLREGGKPDAGHGVGGNRMRRNNQFSLKADEEWRGRLPAYASAMAVFARPLSRIYGY